MSLNKISKVTKSMVSMNNLSGQKIEKKPKNILSLTEMLDYLSEITEEEWGFYAFSRDPLRGKFLDQEQLRLTHLAIACGENEANKIIESCHETDLKQVANFLKLEVNYPRIPQNASQVLFAEYRYPNKIWVYQDCIEKITNVIVKEGLDQLLSPALIQDLLLGHEIFHHIELNNKDTIFTQIEKVELWMPKPFKNRSTIRCLGEIAAMSFSKTLNQVSLSPFVLDVVLVYGYSKEAAYCLFEEIMELTKKTQIGF